MQITSISKLNNNGLHKILNGTGGGSICNTHNTLNRALMCMQESDAIMLEVTAARRQYSGQMYNMYIQDTDIY